MGSEALYIQKRPKIDHGRPGPQTASGVAGDAVLRESFDGHARWVALVDVADTGIPSDHKRAKVVAAAAEADADAERRRRRRRRGGGGGGGSRSYYGWGRRSRVL
jgi:hypothetical protein